jgi:hypothetical protein
VGLPWPRRQPAAEVDWDSIGVWAGKRDVRTTSDRYVKGVRLLWTIIVIIVIVFAVIGLLSVLRRRA